MSSFSIDRSWVCSSPSVNRTPEMTFTRPSGQYFSKLLLLPERIIANHAPIGFTWRKADQKHNGQKQTVLERLFISLTSAKQFADQPVLGWRGSLEGALLEKGSVVGKRRRPSPSSWLNDWLTNSTNFHELAGSQRRGLSRKYDFGQVEASKAHRALAEILDLSINFNC